MKISNIIVRRITENKGHIGFASCVLFDCLKLNNIAIFKRLNVEGYRLVFPEKKIGENKVQIFFPLDKETYLELEKAISESL